MEYRGDLLALLDLDKVYYIRASRRSVRGGDVIALLAVDLAEAREEQQVIVGRGCEHGLDVVVVLGAHGLYALAAAALAAVFGNGDALDIAAVGQGEDALLLVYEVLEVYLLLDVLYLRPSLVAVLVPDGDELVLENASYHLGAR